MVGSLLSERIGARQDGARSLANGVMRNIRGFIGDIWERVDLDENVPKSTMQILQDKARAGMNLISSAERTFAQNNRRGLKR